ncbi:MAG TPA: ASCH domain-containing protein [Ktedonobacteraceae bacterium]|nr:ASCH domain-containing protein [Ktedonobacteraceae bacterium]
MHTMRIKRPYYDAIMAGQKTLEVRVGYDNIKRYQAGEIIRLETSEAWGTVKIKTVRTYTSFEDMLEALGWQKIAPDAGDTATALRTIREIYPPEKEALGVYVFEVEPVSF